MLVVDLHCEHGHVFEGWFGSADDLAAQQARALLSCPVCASTEVVRRPSAARLNVSALKAEKDGARGLSQSEPAGGSRQVETSSPHPAAVDAVHGEPAVAAALQALYLQAVRHVLANTEDVGEGFVEEVRNIHRGDAPQRALRGQADPQEVAELKEEGIDVVPLAIPESLKGPMQ